MLTMLAADVIAQGIGIGAGLDDTRLVGKAAIITPCATSLVFDQSVACNAISFVGIMRY